MNQETLDKELKRLENSNLPEEIKAKIVEFIDDIRLSGLSLSRQYFYAIRLRQVASIIKKHDLSFRSKAEEYLKGTQGLILRSIQFQFKGHFS